MLYDPAHQPELPEGWIFRVLLSLAALMRTMGAALAMVTSGILLGIPFASLIHEWLPMSRMLRERYFRALPDTVMALLISWLLLRFAHRLSIGELGLHWDRAAFREALYGFLAGAVSLALVALPPLLLGWVTFENSDAKVRGLGGITLLVILIAFAAFSEELVMRGYAFQTLVHPAGLLSALILTSGAFSAMHLNNPGMNEFTLANTFLAGCVLGILVVWRRSIWTAAGAHFGWNLATILFGLNLSGLVVPLMPFRMQISGDAMWTGGRYGPEGGIFCTIILSLLLLGLIRVYFHRNQEA